MRREASAMGLGANIDIGGFLTGSRLVRVSGATMSLHDLRQEATNPRSITHERDTE